MKILLRSVYLALIVASVAIHVPAGQRSEGDPVAALRLHLQQMDFQTDRVAETDILSGNTPHCDRQIYGMMLPIDGGEDEQLRGLRSAGTAIRYVYLGSVADRRRKAFVIGRWLWASMLFTVGVRSDKPPSHLVVLALPAACPALQSLDWAALSP